MGLFSDALAGEILQGVVGITGTIVDGVQNKKSREQQIAENQKDRDFAWEQSERQMAFNSYESEEQRQFLSKEAELAYERQQEFYDSRQSPSAMVQQYKEAGLNPMALAGGSMSSSPLSSLAPSGASAASGSAPTVSSSAIPRALDLGDRMISLAKSVEEMRLMRAEARRQTSEALLNEIDSITRGEINQLSIQRGVAEINNTNADTALKQQATAELASRILVNEKTVEEKTALIGQITAETIYTNSKNLREEKESSARVASIYQSISESKASEKEKLAYAAKVTAEAFKVKAETKNLRAMFNNICTENQLKAAQRDEVLNNIKLLKQKYSHNEVMNGFEEFIKSIESYEKGFYRSDNLPGAILHVVAALIPGSHLFGEL